jgi:hypothetical protein
LLSSGDCFALRDLCEALHHRLSVPVQDRRARTYREIMGTLK